MSVSPRVLVTLALLASLHGAALAADIETRDFAVLIGGKAAGEVHMTIHKQDDGLVSLRCDTDIKVTAGLITYKYSFRGMEVWKDRRLVRLESTTDDNSKRYTVSAAPADGALKVRVNNVERAIRPEAWASSYWSLPDPKLRDGTLLILDADCGKELDGRLTYLATEKHRVAGQEVTLNHYKLAGKVNADLWYDGTERLVRQEWVEQGHKAVMVLVRVRR
ncbi:MAG: DUF6134 family protein [Gemmataceae bacterium]